MRPEWRATELRRPERVSSGWSDELYVVTLSRRSRHRSALHDPDSLSCSPRPIGRVKEAPSRGQAMEEIVDEGKLKA